MLFIHFLTRRNRKKGKSGSDLGGIHRRSLHSPSLEGGPLLNDVPYVKTIKDLRPLRRVTVLNVVQNSHPQVGRPVYTSEVETEVPVR